MEIEATPTRVELRLDAGLYNEAVVFKCFYWYGSQYEVEIEAAADGRSFAVVLAPRGGPLSGPEIQSLCSRVRRDLLDFKTRDIVARETRGIRELLVAKAFATSDDLDEPAPAGVVDVAGFSQGQAHARA